MSAPGTIDSGHRCQSCGCVLHIGDAAYVSDWKVIDTNGTLAGFRLEKRYTCEGCEAKP